MSCLVGWFLVALWCLLVGSAWAAKPVGVVDDTLVTHEWWIQPWAAEWSSDKVAAEFRKNGIEAQTIGLKVLRRAAKLAEFQAIIIPTDHNYPDVGSKNGPVSRAIAAYVSQGGVYFMPFGASHFHWRDTTTRAVQPTGDYPSDFLGLKWQITGEHTQPGPALVLTPAGQQAGIPAPSFGQPMATYTRVIEGASKVYVSNKAGQRCLYAVPYGSGALIHYTGGPPLNAAVRDWLIAAYSSILKSGPDLADERLAQIKSSRYYGSELVAERPTPAASGAAQMVLSDGWELAKAPDQLFPKPEDLDKLEWVRTRMPNPVQHAPFEAGKAPNLWYSDNYKQLQWIQRSDWLLRKRFRIPETWSGQRVRLRFDGLDYVGAVWLDGKHLGTHEGMAGGPTFDITGQAQPGLEHELLVRLIHEEQGTNTTFGISNHGGKPSVIKSDAVDGASYIWGNRYRSFGLWQPVRLVATGPAYLEAPWVRTDAINGGSAQLWGQADITNTGDGFDGTVEARVVESAGGREVWRGTFKQRVPSGKSAWEQVITLGKPKLWWPNGLGEQPLYRLDLRLIGAQAMDTVSTRFGVRTLELQRNRVSPDSPRSAATMTATETPDESFRFLWVVNGRPFYAKGASWMTSDDVLMLTPERESWLIKAAKLNGLNEFRLNGGTCLFETEQFYSLCDEAGIVVWQELPLNWATSHGAPAAAWREQLRQNVLRIRQHPSIGCWVGGNEFDPFAPGNVQLLGMAREVIQSYDAQRPFRMSSPGGGTYHAYVPWSMYNADVNWYHRLYDRGHNFISEWSFPAFANYSLLKRVVPPSELDARPVGYDGAAFMKAHPILHDRYTQPDDVGIMSWNRADLVRRFRQHHHPRHDRVRPDGAGAYLRLRLRAVARAVPVHRRPVGVDVQLHGADVELELHRLVRATLPRLLRHPARERAGSRHGGHWLVYVGARRYLPAADFRPQRCRQAAQESAHPGAHLRP